MEYSIEKQYRTTVPKPPLASWSSSGPQSPWSARHLHFSQQVRALPDPQMKLSLPHRAAALSECVTLPLCRSLKANSGPPPWLFSNVPGQPRQFWPCLPRSFYVWVFAQAWLSVSGPGSWPTAPAERRQSWPGPRRSFSGACAA